jgi:CheY-like chemotaxis protein
MADGGQLEIAADNITIDAETARRSPPIQAGSYVRIRVTDTGCGMEPDVAARVFEPFFTTKDVGKGTGLGLSQVYGFVQQSDGYVTIDTKVGDGTTFRLYLPRCELVKAAVALDPAVTRPPGEGSETILVVEDNNEVLELAVATISDLGYRVLAATNGPAALEILHQEAGIDLLFSDVVMPGGMSGFDLVRKARGIRAGLKALLASGYANVQRTTPDQAAIPMLSKPYRRAELAENIRKVLGQV